MGSNHLQTNFHVQALPKPPIPFRSVLLLPDRPLHSRKFITTIRKSTSFLRFSKGGFDFSGCSSGSAVIRSSVAKPEDQKQMGVRRAYPFYEIEPIWQLYWEDSCTFRTPDEVDTPKPKFYVLDIFPYPSGAGLHVGHPLGYTATDILAKFKCMQGYKVLHLMGWDAFRLAADNTQ